MNFFSKDFSVVIQGPVVGKKTDPAENQQTQLCIDSIRKQLPDAEIIISTWKGEETDHLTCDKVIFSDDPGAVTYNDFELKNVYNNNNRQIVSTFAGLKQASRKYSIKMRADLRLESTNFFELLEKYTEVNRFRFLKQRILVSTYFSRNPEKLPLLYHISDLFQIGLTEDLLELWDIPLQPEPETTRAFPYTTKIANDPFRQNGYKMRYASEQYIWFAFCKKKGLDLSLNYFSEVPISLIEPAVVSIIDNFTILSPEQIGMTLPQRLIHGEKKLYTFKEWLGLYNDLCVRKSKFRMFQLILKVKLVSANYTFKNFTKNLKQNFKSKK